MIIFGILDYSNEKILFDKLLTFAEESIIGETSLLINDFISIVASKTPSDINSETLMTDNRLITGTVFNKTDHKKMTTSELLSLKSSNDLVDHYWGNYLFFSINKEKMEVNIVRDPTGQLPLFYSKISSGQIIFSSKVDLIFKFIDEKPEFNLEYFSSYLLHYFITSEQTAFKNIKELTHGCQLTLSKTSIVTQVIWNPITYCSNSSNIGNNYEILLETASNVIKAYSEGIREVYLDFSGGLDSTVLLYLLSSILKPEQLVKPINIFHPKVRSSDERIYARQICEHLNIELLELDNSNYLPFTPMPELKNFKPYWPTSGLMNLRHEREIGILSKHNNNIIHMSGHGGDHIFLCPPPIQSLCDFLIEKGQKDFFKKLKEISTMYRKPLLPILKIMFENFFDYFLKNSYKHESRTLDQHKRAPWFKRDIFTLDKTISPHPFFLKSHTTNIIPGKFNHIDTIFDGLSTIKNNIRNDNTIMFYPFFSQPMIELVLGIPCYLTFSEGHNRYPIRKATADKFNTNFVWRKDKGETSGIMQRGMIQNEKYIQELCLEGLLAKSGLIDRNILSQNLKETSLGLTTYLWPVISLITAEIFISYWS